MSFSLYNKILLLTVSLALLSLMSLSLYMEPISNELTRMGGYLENNYGWNNPQEHFDQPLFKKSKSIDDYNQYYDAIVLGDSFSDNESHGWQNYFAKETGLSILSFTMLGVSIEDILNSAVYKKSPPKLFIYESVERNILSRHNQCNYSASATNSSFAPPPLELNPLEITPKNINRKRSISSIEELNISSAINYAGKSVSRYLFNINTTEVQKFDLTKSGLFSSTIDDSVLIITRDFRIKDVSSRQIASTKCSLLELQNRIRANRKTEFIALIFPDKTSVYSDYLIDRSYSTMSIISSLEKTPGLNIVPLIDKFKKSVEDGVVDFYLPNDTHCGYVAYQSAAFSILDYLNQLYDNKLLK